MDFFQAIQERLKNKQSIQSDVSAEESPVSEEEPVVVDPVAEEEDCDQDNTAEPVQA